MDEIARYNKERWEELARANVQYSRPRLDLDEAAAREMIDPHGLIGEMAGKRVLCLASGGGQQSAAFGVLGADVTVLDLSETQLERDRAAAGHYGYAVELCQGDMRDLSRFSEESFTEGERTWKTDRIRMDMKSMISSGAKEVVVCPYVTRTRSRPGDRASSAG